FLAWKRPGTPKRNREAGHHDPGRGHSPRGSFAAERQYIPCLNSSRSESSIRARIHCDEIERKRLEYFTDRADLGIGTQLSLSEDEDVWDRKVNVRERVLPTKRHKKHQKSFYVFCAFLWPLLPRRPLRNPMSSGRRASLTENPLNCTTAGWLSYAAKRSKPPVRLVLYGFRPARARSICRD